MNYLSISSAMAAETTHKVAVENNLFHGIANSGIVVQVLLLALVGMSVWCWFIIFKKKNQLKTIEIENQKFLEVFWKGSSLQQINSHVEEFENSPIARMFSYAYQELERVVGAAQGSLLSNGIENIERSLRKSHDAEIAEVETLLPVLATTGSTAPFVGLLGTVIGIMNSFGDIAASGSASLSVVAPGISEALFATAVGLFAAIPAVVSYNYLIGEVKKFENQLNGFNSDFLNIARRNFFKQS
jgi:biopolymer transport protein TolQ